MARAEDLIAIAEAHVRYAYDTGQTIEAVWGSALLKILKARMQQDVTDRVLMTLCRICGQRD